MRTFGDQRPCRMSSSGPGRRRLARRSSRLATEGGASGHPVVASSGAGEDHRAGGELVGSIWKRFPPGISATMAWPSFISRMKYARSPV